MDIKEFIKYFKVIIDDFKDEAGNGIETDNDVKQIANYCIEYLQMYGFIDTSEANKINQTIDIELKKLNCDYLQAIHEVEDNNDDLSMDEYEWCEQKAKQLGLEDNELFSIDPTALMNLGYLD